MSTAGLDQEVRVNAPYAASRSPLINIATTIFNRKQDHSQEDCLGCGTDIERCCVMRNVLKSNSQPNSMLGIK